MPHQFFVESHFGLLLPPRRSRAQGVLCAEVHQRHTTTKKTERIAGGKKCQTVSSRLSKSNLLPKDLIRIMLQTHNTRAEGAQHDKHRYPTGQRRLSVERQFTALLP